MRFKFKRYWFPRFGAFMLNRSISNTLYNIQQIYNASFIMFSRHKNIFKMCFHISKAFSQLLLICHKLVLKNGHTNLYWYFSLFPACRFVCIQLTSKQLNLSDSYFFAVTYITPEKTHYFLSRFSPKKKTEKQRKEWIQSLKQ